MHKLDLRARLLAAIGASGLVVGSTLLACGGADDSPNPVPSADAASESGATDSATDSPSTSDAAAIADSGTDALPTVRRPFLVGSSLRSAPPRARDDWSFDCELTEARDLDAKTRERLARAWADDALQEHASIAAFARFTMALLAVGAPPSLVAASQRASLEEIAHARACFALARRYGADIGPGPLAIDGALEDASSLHALAALTAEEGCVGETVGAALAAEQLSRATDPEVRRVLARIVRDEDRHAELAWRFVSWAIRRDPSVRDAVETTIRRAVASTLAMEIRPIDVDAVAWSAHGRLTCAEAREASARAIRDLVLPCLAALGDRKPDSRSSASV